MVRLISCLGFWLTISLFVASGYALGDECGSARTCIVDPPEVQSSASTLSLNETFEGTEKPAHMTGCLGTPKSSVNDLTQGTNREGANPVSAPAVVLTFADNPLRIAICPRAITTWR